MLLEVSLIVLLPPPYGPPGVLLPGLVTVTATLPAAAMAEAAPKEASANPRAKDGAADSDPFDRKLHDAADLFRL